MSAPSPVLKTLNEVDYRRYRIPEELASFGCLQTSAGTLPLQQLDLAGTISGLLFHARLRQRFQNTYAQPLEAIYIFPLPARAAVTSFVMQTEQRRVVGTLQERGEARRQYQQAVAQGKQAALAEEDRSEVFTISVGNIPPGEWVDIELELDGPLTWADGQAMFRFPLVVAPRYIPGTPYSESVGSGISADTNAVPDASRISPPVLLPGYPNPVRLSIRLHVEPGAVQLGSPALSLDDIRCVSEGDGYTLELSPTANRLDRDLIVRFPVAAGTVQTAVQAEREGDHCYFALNLIPDDDHVVGPAAPRQVVTLLDRSGSMQGWKMVCARRAVGRLVDCLTDQDSFQVLNFDTVIEPLDPLKTGLRPASDRERFLSIEQLGGVNERGGTEILQALQAGVSLLRAHPNPILLLITDGQVGNESEVLRWIQQNAQGIRIFTVGIDTAVNVSLLSQLAQVSGGHFTLVESEEQLDQAMVGLRRRISPPLLTEVRILQPGAESSPAQADLYEGNCTRLLGRFPGPLPETLEIQGKDAHGSTFRRKVAVSPTHSGNLRKLWARERVLELEHGFLAGWGGWDYRPPAITQFALEHGVLCRFTAFVAIDEERYIPGETQQVTQAVSTPQGWGSAPPPNLPGLNFRAQVPAPAPMASAAADPFACAPGADPFACAPSADPFACAPSADPFASGPFAPAAADPFAVDPFAEAGYPLPAADPFGGGGHPSGSDPLAERAAGNLPASPPPPARPAVRRCVPIPPEPAKKEAGPDDYEALLDRLDEVKSREELLQVLAEMIALLEKRGYDVSPLVQLRDDFEQGTAQGCSEATLRQTVAQIQATWETRPGKRGQASFWS